MTAATVTPTMDRSLAEPDRALERGHILALDGIRGIAILLVVLCHFQSNLHLVATTNWVRPLLAVAHAGWTGVDLFFVLSGFLITGILIDARGSPSYFKAFYARRALRIIPAYYGFLFVIFVVLPAMHIVTGENAMLAREHQSWYWLYLTNVMMALDTLPGKGPYPSTLFWSLAVEEQFYLAWPLIVAVTSTATLRKVCIGGIVLCWTLRIAGGLSGVSGVALSVLPFTRGDTLFVGGLLAIDYRSGGIAARQRSAGIFAFAAFALLTALGVYYGQLDYNDAGTAMFGSIAIMMLGAWAVVAATSAQSAPLLRVLRSNLLRFSGRYSYAIYIVHTAVLAALDHYRPFGGLPKLGGSALPAQTLWAITYVVVSTGLAVASWHLVEKHFLALKKFFPYRARTGLEW